MKRTLYVSEAQAATWDAARRFADENVTSLSQVVIDALNAYLLERDAKVRDGATRAALVRLQRSLDAELAKTEKTGRKRPASRKRP